MTDKKLLPHLAEDLADLRRLALMEGYEGDAAQQRSVDIDGVLQAAVGMIDKLGVAQAKGRSGWHDPAQCSVHDLLGGLLNHLPKGDPVDWLNFAMMLWVRKSMVEDAEWQTALKEMIDAFCRDQLQKEYEVMEEVYRVSAAEVKAEAEAAQRGSLQLDGAVTVSDLLNAQKVINGYLENVLGELTRRMPQGAALTIAQGVREDGTPYISLGVGATP